MTIVLHSTLRMLRSATLAPFASAVVLSAACDVRNPTNPNDELDELPGTLIAGTEAIPFDASLLWSPDGSEIYYEAADGSVRAVAIGSASARTLDGPRERDELTTARAGGAVYFVGAPGTDQATVFRAAGGMVEALSDRVPPTSVLGQADGRLVLGGPGDLSVAYIVAPDSLYLADLATGVHSFVLAGCHRVVAFAPAGDRLLCRTSGPRATGYAEVDIATGTLMSRPLIGGNATIRIVRWGPEGVRVLFTQNNRFQLLDVESGAVTPLFAPPPSSGPRALDFLNYSWSGDGSRLAYWVHECLRLSRVGECEFGQSILYVVDLAANTGVIAAVVQGERGAEQVALDASGRTAAWVFGGRLYWRNVQ
jgi:hypothetical protein